MKICLDPGHTHKTNQGAYLPYFEGTEVLVFALILKKELEKAGHTVKMTRTEPSQNPALKTRGQAAKDCDLFISIHTDWAGPDNAVLVIDDNATKYSNPGLAHKLGQAIAGFWGCKYRVVYAAKNGRWYDTPQNTGNDYIVMQHAYAKSNMLVEFGNHRNRDFCRAFMDDEKKLELARVVVNVLGNAHKPTPDTDTMYRVVAGSYKNVTKAREQMARLKKLGISSWILKK